MTTPPNDDHELRRMMDDAVSDVHPSRGTDEIRSRAGAPRPSATRWVPITLAAAVATVMVIGGAAWLGRQADGPPAAGPGTIEPTQDSTSTSPQVSSARMPQVLVYFVGQTATGPRLFSEAAGEISASATQAQDAVQQAMRAQPLDPDYSNPFASLDLGVDVTTGAGLVTVDLSRAPDRPTNMSDAEAQMAVQSLLWTVNATSKVGVPVQFTVDGAPVDQVLGVPTNIPLERSSADSVLAPVSISSPGEGAKVPTQFEVTGMASAFEANVVWELKQGDRVVRNGFTTATECCTLSPYTFTVTATPGDYTLVVHDTDESDGEGIVTNQDTKNITVE